VDFYSLIRAEKGLKGSEVALLTVDASVGITEQDKRVAAKIAEMKRAVVVVVNKADLLPAISGAGTPKLKLDRAAQEAYLDYVRSELDELRWADVVFTSAEAGSGLNTLLAAARRAREGFHRRIDNTVLRDVWREAVALSPPPVSKNRELRFHDFRQIGNCPPAFLVEVNEKLIMRSSYMRYLENVLRKHFDFSGTHVELVLYEKRRKR
jgi:GTPase